MYDVSSFQKLKPLVENKKKKRKRKPHYLSSRELKRSRMKAKHVKAK